MRRPPMDTKEAAEAYWAELRKRCPKCGLEKDVVHGFGLVLYPDNVWRPNGWCMTCRYKGRNGDVN